MGKLSRRVACHDCPYRQNFTCSNIEIEHLQAVREQHLLDRGVSLPASRDPWGVSYIVLSGAVSLAPAARPIRVETTEARSYMPGDALLCLTGRCSLTAIEPSAVCQIDLSRVVALEQSEVIYRKITSAYCAQFGFPPC